MPLIRGDELRPELQREVLRRYVHRCTVEHPRGEYHLGTPTQTDAEWLRAHAFYVTRSGHLDQRRAYCEPAIIADREVTP